MGTPRFTGASVGNCESLAEEFSQRLSRLAEAFECMGVGDLHDSSVSFFSPHTHDPVTWRLVTSIYQRRTDHSLELP